MCQSISVLILDATQRTFLSFGKVYFYHIMCKLPLIALFPNGIFLPAL